MDRVETIKILSALRETYPNGADGTENTVNLWTALLEPYEYEKVWQATLELCKEWDGYTMPPPAAIIKKLDNVPSEKKTELRREADQLLRRGSTITPADFQEASPEIQQFFGSANRIRQLAMMDADKCDKELDRFERELPGIAREVKKLALENKEKQLLTGGDE